MMMATSVMKRLRLKCQKESGDDVWDDTRVQFFEPVFQFQFLFLHALDLKSVAALGHHGVNGRVHVVMLQLEPGRLHADLRLILLFHRVSLNRVVDFERILAGLTPPPVVMTPLVCILVDTDPRRAKAFP